MKQFMDKDFLLSNETAKVLYHDYASKMPILDYHCHINPQEIWEDRKFENITQVWLGGDHYKWRVMRGNGVEEYYITGGAEYFLIEQDDSYGRDPFDCLKDSRDHLIELGYADWF